VTEVTVFAGPDGSALFLVDSGQVDVSSAGKTVSLTERKPWKSPPGAHPEKILGNRPYPELSPVGFGENDAFLADPVGSLDKISSMMAQFKQNLDEWVGQI